MSVGRQDVRAYLPYESHVRWRRQIAEWHARLSADLGVVSLGHAVRSGPEAGDAHVALVQAGEAALLGDDLFGPGHVTSYADAQLARFLLYNRQTHELGALYERAVGKLAAEDLKRESDLVSTLEVYCERSPHRVRLPDLESIAIPCGIASSSSRRSRRWTSTMAPHGSFSSSAANQQRADQRPIDASGTLIRYTSCPLFGAWSRLSWWSTISTNRWPSIEMRLG